MAKTPKKSAQPDLRRRTARRVHRQVTADEQVRFAALREQLEQERTELTAKAAEVFERHAAALRPLREAFQALRAERESQGVSLADIQQQTGMTRSALCRLENDLEANPTVATLLRYAEALGKRLLITLVDL